MKNYKMLTVAIRIYFLSRILFIFLYLVAFLFASFSIAHALWGNYGDLMLLYSESPIEDPEGAEAERKARNYEETLLHLGIPQYISEGKIHDEALVRGEFFYHTEIVCYPHEYEKFLGMDWRR